MYLTLYGFFIIPNIMISRGPGSSLTDSHLKVMISDLGATNFFFIAISLNNNVQDFFLQKNNIPWIAQCKTEREVHSLNYNIFYLKELFRFSLCLPTLDIL